jgi:hypothetical protein
MRTLLGILAPFILAATVHAVDVTTPTDLFNGKDFTGWSFIANPATNITQVCTLKDGVISVVGKPVGYLQLAAAPAGNYSLHVEYRWLKDNPKNNSGVLINISSGPVQQNTWPMCFQIQTKTQHAGDIIPMGNATCAEVPAGKTQRDLQGKVSEKPVSEWNACDVVRRANTIDCTVNGVLQNHITQCVPAAGKIGFQLEGYAYELRNVRLTTLP